MHVSRMTCTVDVERESRESRVVCTLFACSMRPTTEATTTHLPSPLECSAPVDDTSTGMPETGYRTIPMQVGTLHVGTKIALMHTREGSAFRASFASEAVTERAGSAAKDVRSNVSADCKVVPKDAGSALEVPPSRRLWRRGGDWRRVDSDTRDDIGAGSAPLTHGVSRAACCADAGAKGNEATCGSPERTAAQMRHLLPTTSGEIFKRLADERRANDSGPEAHEAGSTMSQVHEAVERECSLAMSAIAIVMMCVRDRSTSLWS